jgi:dipeptidyl aminopeptidase/acylaminoacyl peptidase
MKKLVKAAVISAAIGCAFAGSAVSAQAINKQAELFGIRQTVLDIALSPSGEKLVFVAPSGYDDETAYVVDLAKGGSPVPVLGNTEESVDLESCNFATEDRLVCQFYFAKEDGGDLLGFSRMIVVDSDGGNAELLSQGGSLRSLSYVQDGGDIVAWNVADEPGSVLVTRTFVKENTAGTTIYNRRDGLAVEMVDLNTMRRRGVERPLSTATRYLADENGDVRLLVTRGKRAGYWTDAVSFSYRKPGESDWTQFENLGDFVPFAVDTAKNVAYASGKKDGFDALYTVALDGSEKIELLVSRPDADVDRLFRIGKKQRVIGAGYATERREIEFFDDELANLAESMRKALPGNPVISIESSSADETKLLMIASSDTDPGMVYRYDKTTKRLEQIMELRDNLAGMEMGAMRAVTYPAADGTMIPAYLTLPPGSDGRNMQAIVMPHGGPSSRDEWGFDWMAQYFAQRGYAVLQPNFRGSAGYGDQWYLKNGFQSWRTSVGDVVDAGKWLVNEGIANPDQLAIVGWSYGGYAALQSQVLTSDLFKATVAIAPVTDLQLLKSEAYFFTNSRLVSDFVGEGSHIREGSPLQNIGAISSPVLLFHGDTDQNVGVDHSRKMAAAIRSAGKHVEYTEFAATDHFITHRQKRAKMLSDADAFLRRNLNIQ